MNRRIFSLVPVLVLLLLCVGSTTASALQFSDVPTEHWAYQEITRMSDRGVIQGNGGTFDPASEVSRQAFLAMACRASGLDERTLEANGNWWQPLLAYAHYFEWCSPEEINESNRTQPITRQLAAKLLINVLFSEESTDNSTAAFTDRSAVSSACLPHVRAASELGLINGYADGSFRPQGTLTRAAAAAIISRALTAKEQSIPVVAGETVQIPILMYHDVSYLGYGYSKTPEIFRTQMEELKKAGFNTIFFSQLIDYVEYGTALPEKPVIVTLDDGYMTNYTYVLPILKELGMKAEISVIGNAMIYAEWGMDWEQVRDMQESGLVCFQAHTKALHDAVGRTGVLKKTDETWAEYVQVFADDAARIQELLMQETGNQPQVFTYPLGKHNPMTEAIIRQFGYKASLTTRDGVAEVTQGDPKSLYLMDRIGMDFRNGSVLSVLRQFGWKG
ncbi:MAG: polysaccharide deacetylase family protein [Oscillibacter sp.]|nr:polysaccharide deacetylase family protein [Oscillibacter sp.]